MAAQKAPSVVYYVFRGFLLLCLRLVCCRYLEQVFTPFSCSVVKPLLFFMVFRQGLFIWLSACVFEVIVITR